MSYTFMSNDTVSEERLDKKPAHLESLEEKDTRFSNDFLIFPKLLVLEWKGSNTYYSSDLQKIVRSISFQYILTNQGDPWFKLNSLYTDVAKVFSEEHPNLSLRGFCLPSHRWLSLKETRVLFGKTLAGQYYDQDYVDAMLIDQRKIPSVTYSYLSKTFPDLFASAGKNKGSLHLCHYAIAVDFFRWLQKKTGYPIGDWFEVHLAELMGEEIAYETISGLKNVPGYIHDVDKS